MNELDSQQDLKFVGMLWYCSSIHASYGYQKNSCPYVGETFVAARNMFVSWANQMTKLVLHDVNFSVFKVLSGYILLAIIIL